MHLRYLVGIFLLGLSIINLAKAYDKPPKEILEIMQAPALPYAMISPTKDNILFVGMQLYPSIKRVAEPFLRLAGVRVEPKNHSNHDTPGGYGIPLCIQNLTLFSIHNAKEKTINIAQLDCAEMPVWSADGKHFFLKNRTQEALELWIANIETLKLKKISGIKLNPMFGDDVQWMPDQKHLLVKLVPQNLKKIPTLDETQKGPSILESDGVKGQSSTYEKRDTLKDKNDELLFEYFGTSQLAIVDLQGKITPIKTPALYEEITPAPDGTHILVTKIIKPYSYLVTFRRFPKEVEIWNISSLKNITHYPLTKLPTADRVPIRGVPMGPREFFWKPTSPATLFWVEALDGGDWQVNVPSRDKIMMQSAPFNLPATEVLKTTQRFGGLAWTSKNNLALLYEYDVNKQWEQTFIINPEDFKKERKLLWNLSSYEEYAHPGYPVYTQLHNGFYVIDYDDNSIHLSSRGATPKGDRPFLDQLDLSTLKTKRLFRCGENENERFYSFYSNNKKTFLTLYQSQTDVPNIYKRTLENELSEPKEDVAFASTRTRLTSLQDPTPQIRNIKKRLIKYQRKDGINLSFTLYTPPNYKEGTKLPTILYAYPIDYANSDVAGQITGSENTFTRLSDYRLLLMAGYAILDNAAFPIVGDPKKAYDTYLEQLIDNAKAAIDEAVKLGVTDPKRIGVTGHSHGALMTVNLLAHTNLFKAGVATSGSYNKTITPFGFQNERRTLWEAFDVYHKVSPIFFVDKIKDPLLIIHGMDDANPGTTPMQASFLYEAIRGSGGISRLVLLPHEPHWYTARESNEQEIYEMLKWFDKYVKNAPTDKSN